MPPHRAEGIVRAGVAAAILPTVLQYFEAFPVLQQVYLEDSWVESVVELPGGLMFGLEAVVTERHPAYRGPRPGHRYDYRAAEVTVTGSEVIYEPSGASPSMDADGLLGYGNIDVWTVTDDGWSHLEGTWGTAAVLAAEPVLRFLDNRER